MLDIPTNALITVANETIETPLLAADKQVKSYQYK